MVRIWQAKSDCYTPGLLGLRPAQGTTQPRRCWYSGANIGERQSIPGMRTIYTPMVQQAHCRLSGEAVGEKSVKGGTATGQKMPNLLSLLSGVPSIFMSPCQ